MVASVPLVPTFVRARAMGYERRTRDTRRPGSISRLGRLSPDRSDVEGVMTNGSGRLVIRCVIAILMVAISVGTMDSAVAQSRIGQIGRDGLTNRHEVPSSEIEPLLRLEM